MQPLATVSDIEARWRTLSDAEQVVAGTLLEDASDMIRSRWADVDARVTSGSLTANSVIRVVAGMVKRAMMVGPMEGVETLNQGAGPFNQAIKYSNPNGNLYFSADDLRLFDGYVTVRQAWAL